MLQNDEKPPAEMGQQIALAGLAVYAVFAPHSVAASAIGVAFAGVGWVVRTISTGTLGLRRSRFDLIIVLTLLWTVASAVLSEEPRISIAKLQALWCVFLFYLARATVDRRASLMLVTLLIFSGSAGALYSAFDLVRGRGVVIQSIAADSPFRQLGVEAGDTIWRIGGRRVYSVEDIDKQLKAGQVSVGIISRGEQIERPLCIDQPASSGLTGVEHNHRFRASGWTRHYETFAELMQMIAQLALGLALAHLRNHGPNKAFRIAIVAAAIVTTGLVFTAMRTVVVAFVIGACVIALRSLRGIVKVAFTFALFFVLAFAAVVVWQTRDRNALLLGDPSSSLRVQVARVGLSRIAIHPIFGH
ncbi:MAG TPA: PDZ domain-containing protein, partial [Pyrinomonadaceae bacterium]|nr:PDZ domain-containing protein [Pyrinomonadaceae bacterium]